LENGGHNIGRRKMKTLFLKLIVVVLILNAPLSRASIISTWANNQISIYHDYSEASSGYIGGTTKYVLDLNNDGTDEIIFSAGFTEAGFSLCDNTRISGYNYGRNGNLFASSILKNGDIIGESGQVWNSSGYHSVVTMMTSYDAEISIPDPYYNTEYYIGLEISIDNQLHYGWLSIHAPSSPSNRLLVNGWAYEDTPNTPIVAGVIPEPSAIALIGAGILGVWLIRQKRINNRELHFTVKAARFLR